nr:hypothetical protein [Tanacetum cinerariifolium]
MASRTVQLKSGIVNTARQKNLKTIVLVNTARQVSTALPKSTVNAARQMSYLSKSAQSSVKIPIHKKTTFNNSNFNQKVNTVRSKTVNTARPKVVVNVVQAPVDAENWISHMEKIFNVMGCEDAFKTRLAVYKFEGNALAWWKAYKQAKGAFEEGVSLQTDTETSTEFMQRFLRLDGFLGVAAGIAEEQAKNFQWGLR